MDHAPRTMIEMSVSVLLFLTAATSGLLLFQTGAALNAAAYVSGATQDRSLRQTLSPLAGDGSVSGAEVVQSIVRLESGDGEIVVDGVRYAPPIDRYGFIPTGIRLNGRYKVTVERDASGALLRTIFVSR
ncbi:hypothetical protein B5M42_021290 [Paenibacillus athensensis]|uniref:Uncharacterized protein n=1 Tax=Paenibacillus athensensis TaxID=1967502 RepID=A0A4Y8Q0K9_9BACL|nr:hypothetical protein [Paenibacillus athensensis]MCD1261339.1 hypothetical protein [Paenibacillus athensensis]